MQKYQTLIIGKGKKYVEFQPVASNKDAIIKAALGRTGNLRAPALAIDDKLVIGFNADMYEKFVRRDH